MIRLRRDRTLGWVRRDLHGPSRDRVKAERPALVRDAHGPIHVLFQQHMGGPDRRMNLIESSLMRYVGITEGEGDGA